MKKIIMKEGCMWMYFWNRLGGKFIVSGIGFVSRMNFTDDKERRV